MFYKSLILLQKKIKLYNIFNTKNTIYFIIINQYISFSKLSGYFLNIKINFIFNQFYLFLINFNKLFLLLINQFLFVFIKLNTLLILIK